MVYTKNMNTNRIESLTLEQNVVEAKGPHHVEVMMLNDDYTPMEFVVSLLKDVFSMNKSKALQVMFQVHYENQASCGFYPTHIAKAKINAAKQLARQQGFPLKCIIKRPISS